MVDEYDNPPQTLTFQELLDHPLYFNYYEQYGRWKILLFNGWWYSQSRHDSELGEVCEPLSRLDTVYIWRLARELGIEPKMS